MSGMMHSRPFRCSGIRIHMSQSQSWGRETAAYAHIWGHHSIKWLYRIPSGCPHKLQSPQPSLLGLFQPALWLVTWSSC